LLLSPLKLFGGSSTYPSSSASSLNPSKSKFGTYWLEPGPPSPPKKISKHLIFSKISIVTQVKYSNYQVVLHPQIVDCLAKVYQQMVVVAIVQNLVVVVGESNADLDLL
jgi:hypothetical protein